MADPKTSEIRIKFPADDNTLQRLKAAAAERHVSPQLLAANGIRAYLEDLIPIGELSLTYTERDGHGGTRRINHE